MILVYAVRIEGGLGESESEPHLYNLGSSLKSLAFLTLG